MWDEFLPVRYKSDTTGPLAGVPYDGVQTIADGKGKWWEGMDPQMLNGKPHLKNTPCPEFTRQFMLRVQDVIDSHDPDLLYFDDNAQFDFDAGGSGAPDLGVWLGIPDLAPQIMAYYYNKNMKRHGGRLEAVLNLKTVPEPVWGTLTRDFEAALEDKLQKNPWQTDACIGSWHYSRPLFETHRYQKASTIIPMFVDIVSKNGNLLLNIPLPGHGEPDSDEMAFLSELVDWQQINSEAITGSRPWKVYGEGPSIHAAKIESYQLNRLKFDHSDIRFTTKGDTLFAIVLGWPPDGRFLITSLAGGSTNYPGQIGKVELLGSKSNFKVDEGNTGPRDPSPRRTPVQVRVCVPDSSRRTNSRYRSCDYPECIGANVLISKFSATTTLLFSIAMCVPGLAGQLPLKKAIVVASPDGKVRAELSVTDGVLSYRVTADGKQVLGASKIGIEADDVELGEDVTLGAARVRKINEQYRFFGAHAMATNRANEAVIPAQSYGESYFVDVHVANDGVGVRLRLPAKQGRKIQADRSTWALEGNPMMWVDKLDLGYAESRLSARRRSGSPGHGTGLRFSADGARSATCT